MPKKNDPLFLMLELRLPQLFLVLLLFSASMTTWTKAGKQDGCPSRSCLLLFLFDSCLEKEGPKGQKKTGTGERSTGQLLFSCLLSSPSQSFCSSSVSSSSFWRNKKRHGEGDEAGDSCSFFRSLSVFSCLRVCRRTPKGRTQKQSGP